MTFATKSEVSIAQLLFPLQPLHYTIFRSFVNLKAAGEARGRGWVVTVRGQFFDFSICCSARSKFSNVFFAY